MHLLERTFGIEMEWSFRNYNSESLARVLRNEMDIRITDYGDHDSWSINCDGGDYGLEVRTPVSTWKNWEEIKAVTRVLRRVGDGYDSQCGMHVHLGIEDLNRDQLLDWIALWSALESGIFKLVNRRRRTSTWCRSMVSEITWPIIQRDLIERRDFRFIDNHCRRYALNPRSHWNTSEVRLHQASIDPIKQRGWLLMFQVLMNHAKEAKLTAAQFIELYALSPNDKIKWIYNVTTDHLDQPKASWLQKHIAWRAQHYSNVTIAA